MIHHHFSFPTEMNVLASRQSRNLDRSEACWDDPKYLSPHDISCAFYKNLPCGGFRLFGFTALQVRELLERCPRSCHVCGTGRSHFSAFPSVPPPNFIPVVPVSIASSCQDNKNFRDKSGFSCLFYLRISCGNLVPTYDRSDMLAIRSNCKKSCGYCPTFRTGSYAPTIPSGYPNQVPSVTAYNTPSTYPSEYPTVVPSKIPTSLPMNGPSLEVPSTLPSPSFSELSSGVPSESTTLFITSMPWDSPSDLPIVVVSPEPTHTPSSLPITSPTGSSTDSPSFFPNFPPTGFPSGQPPNSSNENSSRGPTDIPSTCEDDVGFQIRGHRNRNRTCSNWVVKNPGSRCTTYVASQQVFVFERCPRTCYMCDDVSALHSSEPRSPEDDGSSTIPSNLSSLAPTPFLSVFWSNIRPNLSSIEIPTNPTIFPSSKLRVPSRVPSIDTPSGQPTNYPQNGPSSIFPTNVPDQQSRFSKNRSSLSPSLPMPTLDSLPIPSNPLSRFPSETSRNNRPPCYLFTRNKFPPISSRAPLLDCQHLESSTLPTSVSNRETYAQNGGGVPQYSTNRAALCASLGLIVLSFCSIVGIYAHRRYTTATPQGGGPPSEHGADPVDVRELPGGIERDVSGCERTSSPLHICFSSPLETSFLGDAPFSPQKSHDPHMEETEPVSSGTGSVEDLHTGSLVCWT